MSTIILIIHIVVSIFLILIVLLQIGRGATLSGLFGGGSSEAFLGVPSGDVFLKRLTVVFAVVFMLTSLSLTIISSPKKTILRRQIGSPISPQSSQEQPTSKSEK